MKEENFPILKQGVATYAPPWRDWWHTEIVTAPDGARVKLIPVGGSHIEAAIMGYDKGQDVVGVPTCIAMTNDRKSLRVWPTPDRDYEIWLPEPLIPNSPYAGRYARKEK